MSEAAEFFDRFKNKLVGGLNTCAIAQIEAFDATRMKADIKILPDGGLIKSAPVASIQNGEFVVRMPYKKGDHVLIVFAQRDIDAIMFGGKEPPSKRMLAMDDAIVVGGINLFTKPMSGADADAVVIGKKDGAAKIVLGSDNSIKFIAPGGVALDGGAGGVTIKGATTIQGGTKTESW